MWDFILPNLDSEMEQEVMPVSTRRKSTLEPIQTIPKKKTTTPSTKYKTLFKLFQRRKLQLRVLKTKPLQR